MTRAERRSHWQSIVNDHAASGMSAAVFCRQSQVKLHLFYSWRRRFRETQSADGGGFVELLADQSMTDAGIRIRLAAGVSIEVARGFDPATLCAVIDVLHRHRCSA